MNEELGNAPVGKLLFKLAVPAVFAQLVFLLYTVVDRIYIGHIPEVGSAALTGVGLCLPVVTIINAFAMLIAQGGAPQASIALGKQDKEMAERILGNCASMLTVVAVTITVLAILFGRQLLMMFGASEATIVYAYPYLCCYVAGTIFVMLALGLNQFATSQGYTKYSMISVLIGAISNIILDPVFIFVFHMGVKGAAYATVISQALSCIYIIRFLQGPVSGLHIKRRNMKVRAKIMLPVLALGASPFVMQVTEAALSLSFNVSLQKYGGDLAVGAMTISSTVMQMFFVPTMGIGQGAQPIISYNFGAGNAERVKRIMKLYVLVSEGVFFFFWLLVELRPQMFILLFNPTPELFQHCVWALRVYVATIGFFGFQNAAQQFFVATGQALVSIFIAVLRKVILLIPLIFILPNFFENKVFAVFFAEPVADFLSVTVATSLLIYKFPRILKQCKKKEA